MHSSFFGVPVRIKSINFKDSYGWVNTTLVPDTKSDASLFPVSLTPEILERNGWKELEWKDVNYHPGVTTAYKNDDYIIQIGYNESIHKYDIFDGFISFGYVHELQHALRLCGLNDLADNFKL